MIQYTERDINFTRKIVKAMMLKGSALEFVFDDMHFRLKDNTLKLAWVHGKLKDVLEIPSLVPGENKFIDSLQYKISTIHNKTIKCLKVICRGGLTDTSEMFSECVALKHLDITELNTSKVTHMQRMFFSCKELEELDLSNFNTSKVTTMFQMFYDCNNVRELDMSKFDTSQVLEMSSMFYGCNSLNKLDLRSFNTSKSRRYVIYVLQLQ